MNYYDVFGVSRTASSEDISAAHKSLAKMYHPDISDSEDAHERMALLNEANEVLSDIARRREYDSGLKRDEQHRQMQEFMSAQRVKAKWSGGVKITDEREERAVIMRRKAEAKLKAEEALRAQRIERDRQRAAESAKKAAQKHKQVKADLDRQHVLNVLSGIVIGDNTQRKKRIDIDEERHHATKVLLSLVRNDNEPLRRMAEEIERKQKIDEILSLVKEFNEEANPDRLV